MGKALGIQLFGESHGPLVGVCLEGLPAGLLLDMDALTAFLQRRAAKGSPLATGRREADEPRVVSGLYKGYTTGQPLTALFDNADPHSGDYAFLPDQPRPGHADYPALRKSGGYDDLRGSGHHSGRLTLPYAFGGAVACQLLQTTGVRIYAHVLRVGPVEDSPRAFPSEDSLLAARERPVPTLDPRAGEAMAAAVLAAKAEGDSLGGLVECIALGLPVGLGAPFFEGVEALAAAHLFSIPGVKGVEFGAGFSAAALRGSQYNDPYTLEDGQVRCTTNQAGGLLGGLTNGMPLVARAAFRPTPSISLPQRTVSLARGKEETLTVQGRHDPCIAIRAVPLVEGALALALADLWLQQRGNGPLR